MKKSFLGIVGTAAAVAVVLAGCSTPAPEASEPADGEVRPVTVAALPISETAALWAAIDAGIFEAHGLDVEVQPAQGGAQAIPALLNGDIQFAIGQPFGPFRADLQDLGVVILGNYASSLPDGPDVNAVVAPAGSDIQSPADLAGKRVSVNSLGAAGDVTIMEAVRADGGDPSTIEFVEVAFPDVPAQLEAGAIDAAWVPEPFVSQVVGGGGSVVTYPYQATIPGLPTLVSFTTTALQESDPQLVDDFRAALAEALEWSADNDPALRQAIKDNLEIPDAVVDGLLMPEYTSELDVDALKKLAELAIDFKVLDSLPDFDRLISD